ncbi:MAG: tripartite tricarboxylate transporter TctB family protein [Devosia sp.]
MRLQTLVRDGDVLAGAALAGLGAFVLATGAGYDYWSPSGPGPGFFPVWYGGLMITLSLGMIASRILRGITAGQPIDWPGLGRALFTWAAFVVTIGAMPFVGFLIGFALFCLVLMVFVFARPVLQAAIASIAIAAAFQIIFVILLQVDLPAGPLGV